MKSPLEQAQENYQNLVQKVDQKFHEIHARHSSQFRCRKACHQCCAPGLSVSPIEKENLAAYIRRQPGLQDELVRLAAEDPHAGSRCSFLDAEGACKVYPARPLICRSHGAPIVVRLSADEDEDPAKDVCPLNFQNQDLESLDNVDFINVETVNAILAVIHLQWLKDSSQALQRTLLSVHDILSDTKSESEIEGE